MESNVPGVAAIAANNFGTARLRPERIAGVLRTETVYWDGDGVQATFRVSDGTQFNVDTTARTVFMQLEIQLDLGSETSDVKTTACGGSDSGLCSISMPVPDGWFDTGGEVTVKYGFMDGSGC